ncbi:MAG: prephenate dehydrogenase [Ferruginibacter sp.]
MHLKSRQKPGFFLINISLMRITIIGIGLIGGSMAIKLKESGFATEIIAVDNNDDHCRIALEKGLADQVMTLEDAITISDLIIVAIPVDATLVLLPRLLSLINKQAVMDVGSTKQMICEAVKDHPKRSRFCATHPMWGTEYSGPLAATVNAFSGKAAVICNALESDGDVLDTVKTLYAGLNMHLVTMDAKAHDVHTAYISHVSHITSFALANTVLEKEKEDDAIFELASGGFESTVRLAKSNPEMWVPIFEQNRDNVLDVLNEHISQLKKFKACLEKDNYEYLAALIKNANSIERIIK